MDAAWGGLLVSACVAAGPCLYWVGRLSARVDKAEEYIGQHRVEVEAKSALLLRNDEILRRAVETQDAIVEQLAGIYERLRSLEIDNARTEGGHGHA